MASPNPLNVYSGPDSVKKYFDPDFQPLIPLVEIPECLNPFRQDGVRIYAKMMTMHPANNVKIFPAINMLDSEIVTGKTKTVVEYSSGSTIISMSLVSRIYHGINDVRAFLSNKTSDSKLKMMQFFGLDITLFGGPSQPEPGDERGGIQRARAMAEKNEGVTNANQYENDANWKSHLKWTGPQIVKQLPDINVICAGMGTSGTMTGIGMYFKDAKPDVLRVAVCTAPGDRVPGPRSFALLSPVEFPWREAVDVIEEVGSLDSFAYSLNLCREGLICGPSSGFNLKGLFQYLEKRKASDTLDGLRGPDGTINCVFMCCDLPYQYMNEYFDRLGTENFHPVRNENLARVDLYRYDEAWEQEPLFAFQNFYDGVHPNAGTVVLDLRTASDFASCHLPGSISFPLDSLDETTPSPFFDPALLERQWTELESIFGQKGGSEELEKLRHQRVLLACYGGDTARVATSVLRAKGIEASSIKGGFCAAIPLWPSPQGLARGRPLGIDVPEHNAAKNAGGRADSLSPKTRVDVSVLEFSTVE